MPTHRDLPPEEQADRQQEKQELLTFVKQYKWGIGGLVLLLIAFLLFVF